MPYSTSDKAQCPESGSASIGVALVERMPLVREGMAALAHRSAGLRWVGAADTPQTMLHLVDRFHPDVVMIDSALDPTLTVSGMLADGPGVGVLVLARDAHVTAQFLAAARTAGVHGVVLRSAEPVRLLEAIRAVHADRRYLDPDALNRGRDARVAVSRLSRQALSRREFEVLQLIADGLENQAIGKVLYVSIETIRTHVKGILRKLGARDRTHAVALAFRAGILSVQSEPTVPTGVSIPAGRGSRTCSA